MFSDVVSEVVDRCFRAQQFLKAADGLDPMVAKAIKGLTFVKLYAAHEYALTQTYVEAVRVINGYAIPAAWAKNCLFSVGFADHWRSVNSLSPVKSWDTRLKILGFTDSSEALVLSEESFPFDNSHFRVGQIETLWKVLGIVAPFCPSPRHLGWITEIVEHRNAIAHGRDLAENIGGRYTHEELAKAIVGQQEISLHVINVVEAHCSNERSML
jgi:hypothetical protein